MRPFSNYNDGYVDECKVYDTFVKYYIKFPNQHYPNRQYIVRIPKNLYRSEKPFSTAIYGHESISQLAALPEPLTKQQLFDIIKRYEALKNFSPETKAQFGDELVNL